MFRHREAVSWKIINGFFEAIHKENTTRKVFVSGFCWGGRYACLLAQREKWLLSDRTYREGGLVDAVFAAHPCESSIFTASHVEKPAPVNGNRCGYSATAANHKRISK